MKAVKVEFDNGVVRYYRENPCQDDCFGDGLPTVHYHQLDGDDIITKAKDENN